MQYTSPLFWTAVAALLCVCQADAAQSAVDLELVIAADTSSSIDDREAGLEREGVNRPRTQRKAAGAGLRRGH